MKLKILVLIIFFCFIPQVIGAQDLEPSPTPINVGQIMKLRNANNVKIQDQIDARNERKEEIVQRIEQKREEIRTKLTKKRQERIADLYARISKRNEVAIDRMTTLADRILARLDILESEGEDVSSLEAEVNSAKDLVESAEEILVSLEGVVDEMLESEEPKAIYPVVQDSVKEIKDTLKDAHSILVSVITQINGLRVGNI